MEILLRRTYNNNDYCIGHLYIDGKYICDTLEDTCRGLKQTMKLDEIKQIKIPNKTAIPTGRYLVTTDVISPKYYKRKYYYNFCKGKVPRLINVPSYDGILLHIGNTKEDTSGCILVGENKIKGKVINSTKTFEKLYNILKTAKDLIYINIFEEFKK